MERVLQIEHDPERERSRRFPAGDQQRVEHPAAMLPVIRQAAKEHRGPLSPRRKIDRIGRLGAFGLGQLGRPENQPTQHRVGVGPRPAARQVDRPRVGLGRLVEPSRDRDRPA